MRGIVRVSLVLSEEAGRGGKDLKSIPIEISRRTTRVSYKSKQKKGG